MSKKCTPLWREAHFKVKMYKTHQLRTTFWSCDVEKVHAVVARSIFWSQNVQSTPCSDHFWKLTLEKVHAVVARSTFPSQNAQNTPCSDHFWKLRCRKSARRCGAKHISKSKCTKHTMLGPLLEVELSKKSTPLEVKSVKNWRSRTTFGSWVSKKCTPLWREAHFQVKMYQTHHARTTFGSWVLKKCTLLWREAHFQVKMYKTHHARTTFGSWVCEKVYAVVARSTFPSENVQSTPCSDHFWMLRCLHYTTLHYITVLS